MLNSSLVDRMVSRNFFREIILGVLDRAKYGQLIIKDNQSTYQYSGSEVGPKAQISVIDPSLYRRLAFGGSVAVGETYFEQLWETPNLRKTLDFFVRNSEELKKSLLMRLQSLNLIGRFSWNEKNTVERSRKNIHAHYDVGNHFYELILDETMTYSCALFRDESKSLEQAQKDKYERICRKLQLGDGDQVLEIGSGWGGFADYAVNNYPIELTTTTISEEQYKYTKRRVERSGIDDRVTVLDEDYRRLSGAFDKIVSIEMVEAVGKNYLDRYFRILDNLIKDGGRICLQSILIANDRYSAYKNSRDFIQEYVFPGGHLPSLKKLREIIDRHTDLRLHSLAEIGPDYVKTLEEWYRRLRNQRREIRNLGFSERFIRLWEYYLNYCIAGFDRGLIGDIQLTLSN